MTTNGTTLKAQFAAIRSHAAWLAGSPHDMVRRSAVYRNIYRHSDGNHGFSLLAAHGALWGKRYLDQGTRLGQLLSLIYLPARRKRGERLTALDRFTSAFREINRGVCVEVCTTYLFSDLFGNTAGAEIFIEPDLLDGLNRCHRARHTGQRLGPSDRQKLFEVILRWEQRSYVASAVEAAFAAFDWRPVRTFALRPRVRFTYMKQSDALVFADFTSTDERIARGVQAYELSEAAGLGTVEAALDHYGIDTDIALRADKPIPSHEPPILSDRRSIPVLP